MTNCIAITDKLFNEAPVEDWCLDTARQNLLNLTDTIFADGTWGIEPDCVQWTQLQAGRKETGRGRSCEFNFRCDAVYSIMSGDREAATPVIEQLTLYECVSLTETVLRYWLCTFLSRPSNWQDDYTDILQSTPAFMYAARKVFELPRRMRPEAIIESFCQKELQGLNTKEAR